VDVTTSLNGANLMPSDVTIDDSANQNRQKGVNINADGNVKITQTTFNNNGPTNGNTGRLQVTGGERYSASVEESNNQIFGVNINNWCRDHYRQFLWQQGPMEMAEIQQATLQVTTDDISLMVSASNNFYFGAHLKVPMLKSSIACSIRMARL
jgi:hypothetical protein